MKTTNDVQTIALTGVGLIIDARKYTAPDIQKILLGAKSTVIIKNAHTKTTNDLQIIALTGAGKQLILDLTES